jgi:HK97 family phage major capsid protein
MSKIVVPQTGEELAEFLNDHIQVSNAAKEGQLAEVVKAYANACAKKDTDIAAQVREQTQAVLADYLRENEQDGALKRLREGGTKAVFQHSALYNSKAPGAPLDKDFDGTADYFRTIWHQTNRMDPAVNAKLTRLRNAASTTDPAGGGFLVPEVLRSELQRIALENSVVRSRARVIPMETSRVGFPAVDSTSNVSSVYGGIIGYWTEEGAQLTESEPKFSQIYLDAKKLTTYSLVNNELLTDSGASFEAFANQAFPEAMAFYEDVAFLSGNGVGQPKGVYNSSAVVSVDRGTDNTVVYADIVNMYSRMLPGSLGRAVWVVSPDVFPQLATMVQAGGNASAYGLDSSVANALPLSLFGRPVIISEKAPKLGSTADVSFLDFGFYLIGDRMAMTATSSPHYKFQTDQTAFKIVSRVDGRAWLQSAITPQNGSTNTLSPFVTLAA